MSQDQIVILAFKTYPFNQMFGERDGVCPATNAELKVGQAD